MVAARTGDDAGDDARTAPIAGAGSPDWLSIDLAACELGISGRTVRRRIRSGDLRNRIVRRPGGFAYLVYVPDSRHGRGIPCLRHAPAATNGLRSAMPRESYTPHNGVLHDPGADADEIRRLEGQVERLSAALARALRVQHATLPEAAAGRLNPDDPYARYRWLVRKRRWWPF